MDLLSLLNVHHLILFETALRNADAALLQSLRYQTDALGPRRRKLLEAELARRQAAANAVIMPFL